MFDLNFFKNILYLGSAKFPDSRSGGYEQLFTEGLTMGTLYIGRQGTGKTTALARHLVDYFKAFPDRAIFVLDWSGSITDGILSLVSQDNLFLKRIIYDEMGHPEWTIPLPEFSGHYGSYEEHIQRLSNNLAKLSPELV